MTEYWKENTSTSRVFELKSGHREQEERHGQTQPRGKWGGTYTDVGIGLGALSSGVSVEREVTEGTFSPLRSPAWEGTL